MRIAFVFPGQGSQSVSMLADYSRYGNSIKNRLSEADEILGFDLSKIVSEGPEDLLNQTEITQPAILAVSVGLYDLWQSFVSIQPVLMAGHSLGEFSALTCAGALEFTDAVSLVYDRGRLMQGAVPRGEGKMMAVLGLDDVIVENICAEASGIVTPANFNSPGQVVVAGEEQAVELVAERCKEKGARRVLPLDVSVPSHCPLMKGITEKFQERLYRIEIRTPTVPIVQNATAKPTTDPDVIRHNLVAQLSCPVRWHHCVMTMINIEISRVLECGPGKVLTGLMRRIDRATLASSLSDPKEFENLTQSSYE
ncbi:MAG: ACP S-malonyltransferase [Gammaproteobacteria bacterium]|nr:ACP S-malonyltransferase [Gammaproteobacteria bacterium]MYF53148.1 ACP S-malonyltransferase [Gammaproteobacteria bacterium]MYK43703.1 ACP S-malonyltransferase [Gammaproteobacteria bacterium]